MLACRRFFTLSTAACSFQNSELLLTSSVCIYMSLHAMSGSASSGVTATSQHTDLSQDLNACKLAYRKTVVITASSALLFHFSRSPLCTASPTIHTSPACLCTLSASIFHPSPASLCAVSVPDYCALYAQHRRSALHHPPCSPLHRSNAPPHWSTHLFPHFNVGRHPVWPCIALATTSPQHMALPLLRVLWRCAMRW